jgi:hypothetical protein
MAGWAKCAFYIEIKQSVICFTLVCSMLDESVLATECR